MFNPDAAPDRERQESIEDEKFCEIAKQAAERGLLCVHASWPPDTRVPKQKKPIYSGYATVTDPRGDAKFPLVAEKLSMGGWHIFEKQYGNSLSPFQILGQEQCQEEISAFSLPGEWGVYSMKDITGRQGDAGEKPVVISYKIENTDKRGIVDYSLRGSVMSANMIVPGSLAKELYPLIQQKPGRIRELLYTFNDTITTGPDASGMPEKKFTFLEQLNLPTSEANVVVMPLDNKQDAYEGKGSSAKIKPEYIKRVAYEK